ncbi:MAG: hypothetical protein KC777_08020 [Cyanobacteria bacterium HKST-UBA02]|nr:hypothetical protein [Cyanobacteria bacterium HKST-UBA02]
MIRRSSRSARSKRGSSIAELGASFYAFCFCVLIPTVNILGFAVSISYSYFYSTVIADRVAQSMSIKRAKQILAESKAEIESNPLARLLKVAPAKEGFTLQTTGTGSDEIRQYVVRTPFAMKPAIELSGIPVINEIPVVGKETSLTFDNFRDMEHETL